MATWLLNEDLGVELLIKRTSDLIFKHGVMLQYHPEPVPCISLDAISGPEDRAFVRDGGRALRVQFAKATLLQFVPRD